MLPDRIENRIIPEPNSGCHLWLGPLVAEGYGMTYYNGKNRRVHRLIYEDRVGPIPRGMMVCHRCDVVSCCNEDHLFLGTAADNNRDMVQKKRNAPVRGEANGQATLTISDVIAMRASTAPFKEIASQYGVHYQTVYRIKRGLRWGHVV